ncbi:transcriptional regulator, TetR family [Frankia torreyi]|uniref:Transcriptional regulator, TetR family n=1 Tax=Frankia torreyi TaxID=1856 RepID=A0A0D8BJB4_9ACTN|nr:MULTISPECIES: TetR family transcriptional regulator [Frankia]KJE24206.1 transcriptional regulator, TetR family [Frankia torreyi]KQM06123.1 transcriptional regulator, TetR family [Frankia sp. CpI1-P]
MTTQAGMERAPVEPPAEARPAELGLRERKKLRTRRALRMAAIRLVAERGLDGVSVDEIAAAAEVSTRTFFNYFPTKDDAIVGIDPEDIREITEALAARPAGEEPLAAVRAVMLQRAALIAPEQADLWRTRLAIIRRHPHLMTASAASWSSYENALAEAVGSRCGLDPARDPYPAVLVAAVLAIVRILSVRWQESPGAPLADLLGQAFDSLARGLPPPPPPPRAASA